MKEFTLPQAITLRTKELLEGKSAEEKMDDLVKEMKVLMQVGEDANLPE